MGTIDRKDQGFLTVRRVANPSVERLKALSVLPGYRLAVTFRDSTCEIVDLSRVKPDPSHGVFSALADPRLFEQARIELGRYLGPASTSTGHYVHQTLRVNFDPSNLQSSAQFQA